MAWHSVYTPLTAMALSESTMPPEETSSSDMQIAEESSDTPSEVEETTIPAEQPPLTISTDMSPVVPPATLPPESSVSLPELIINRVVAGVSGRTSHEYIELRNPNPQAVVLDNWHVLLQRKDGSEARQVFLISGTVQPNGYVLLAGEDVVMDDAQPDFRLKTNSIVTTGGIIQLLDQTNSVVEELRWGDTTDSPLTLPTDRALMRAYQGNVPKGFMTGLIDSPPRAGGFVPTVAVVNHCRGIVISEIAANVADELQFVELHNTSNESRMLDGCLLQTSRSTTKQAVLAGSLPAGEYRAVGVAEAGLALTKTTTGTVYLLSSDNEEEIDVRSYSELAEEASWSWFGGTDWRQTFARTPGAQNAWQEFLPCEDGYERSVSTGRCRKIAAPEPMVECGPGQYRNPDTNRCRAILVAASGTLTPCREGQYRHSETNRCRNMATLTSQLAPCRAGQERNPETNRCRNISSSIPEAAFAVEPIAETGKAFMGWWALGGVGMLAAGYGAWEWRREAVGGLKKLGTFFTSGK